MHDKQISRCHENGLTCRDCSVAWINRILVFSDWEIKFCQPHHCFRLFAHFPHYRAKKGFWEVIGSCQRKSGRERLKGSTSKESSPPITTVLMPTHTPPRPSMIPSMSPVS